jgi:hypothetical protein
VTRRYCLCGAACWTLTAWLWHIEPKRPGCREIGEREHGELYGPKPVAS